MYGLGMVCVCVCVHGWVGHAYMHACMCDDMGGWGMHACMHEQSVHYSRYKKENQIEEAEK